MIIVINIYHIIAFGVVLHEIIFSKISFLSVICNKWDTEAMIMKL